MKRFAYALALTLVASTVSAAPLVTLTEGTTSGGLKMWTLGLNPNGSTDYTAVDVKFDATEGTFNNPSAASAIFAIPSEQTGAIGVGTVTGGYTFVGLAADQTNLDFVFSSFGPATSTFSGNLAQITGGDNLKGSVVVSFADSTGSVLTSYGTTLNFGEVIVDPPAPDLGLMATNAGGLSAALQGVWNSKVSGSSISLIDGLMITNDDPNSDDITELGAIGSSVEITNYAGQGVIGTVSAGTVPGKYSLLLTGPFQDFDPSVPLTGNVNFTSANGGNASLAFSVAVPEPSTVALSALALVGLVGFARRKK